MQRLAGHRAGDRVHAGQPVPVEEGRRLGEPPRLADLHVLEQLEHLVLGIGGGDGIERLALLGALDRLLLGLEQLRRVLALDAGLHERAQRVVGDLERFHERAGRALGRGGGVVELVREPGGHRAERREPLAVGLDRGQPRGDRRDLAHDPLVHEAVLAREVDEPLARDQRDPDVGLGVHREPELLAGQRGDRADPGRWVLMADVLAAPVDHEQRLQRALEQEVQAPRSVALLDHRLAFLERVLLGRLAPALELGVVDAVEEVDPPQLVDRHGAARYSWISDTAIEPSPTALATRLIERERTSPATNTPGTLVSSTYGSRLSGKPAAFASAPARMKPRSSRATTPSSQSVRGAAPMNTKQASTSWVLSVPSWSTVSARRWSSAPCAAVADAPVRTSMFAISAICAIR